MKIMQGSVADFISPLQQRVRIIKISPDLPNLS